MTRQAVEASDDEIQERLFIACAIELPLGRTRFSIENGIWADYAPSASAQLDRTREVGHVKGPHPWWP